jgi:hypothetical protein
VFQSDVDSSLWLRLEPAGEREPGVLMLGVGSAVSPYTSVEIIVTREMAQRLSERLGEYLGDEGIL